VKPLQDKVAIVTGASSPVGIGAAVARRLAGSGARLLLAADVAPEVVAKECADMLGDPNATEARLNALIELMKTETVDGQKVIDNPVLRDRLMQLQGRVLSMKFNGLRLITSQLSQEPAGLAGLASLQSCSYEHSDSAGRECGPGLWLKSELNILKISNVTGVEPEAKRWPASRKNEVAASMPEPAREGRSASEPRGPIALEILAK